MRALTCASFEDLSSMHTWRGLHPSFMDRPCLCLPMLGFLSKQLTILQWKLNNDRLSWYGILSRRRLLLERLSSIPFSSRPSKTVAKPVCIRIPSGCCMSFKAWLCPFEPKDRKMPLSRPTRCRWFCPKSLVCKNKIYIGRSCAGFSCLLVPVASCGRLQTLCHESKRVEPCLDFTVAVGFSSVEICRSQKTFHRWSSLGYAVKNNLLQHQVSILGPSGYGPTALPLSYAAVQCLNDCCADKKNYVYKCRQVVDHHPSTSSCASNHESSLVGRQPRSRGPSCDGSKSRCPVLWFRFQSTHYFVDDKPQTHSVSVEPTLAIIAIGWHSHQLTVSLEEWRRISTRMYSRIRVVGHPRFLVSSRQGALYEIASDPVPCLGYAAKTRYRFKHWRRCHPRFGNGVCLEKFFCKRRTVHRKSSGAILGGHALDFRC